jgi:hypothetical protein
MAIIQSRSAGKHVGRVDVVSVELLKDSVKDDPKRQRVMAENGSTAVG